MIKCLNHVAIAVRDLEQAITLYRDALGAEVSEPSDYPEHGVRVAFVNVGNTKIELLYPLGDDSPISAFLERNPNGGIHHICVEVDDVKTAGERLQSQGVRLLNDGNIRPGAHDKPVLFLHPKDMCGTLVELEQV